MLGCAGSPQGRPRIARHVSRQHILSMVQFDRDRLAELCREFGVERLRVFGSAARGEERPGSDVDLIADFRESKGYFELVDLEDRLSELFGRSVDLLTENGISPYLKDEILATTSVLFDEG